MRYEITVEDSGCSPTLPGKDKLEVGDIVSLTTRKNKTTHTFIVVKIDHKEIDVCGECDIDMAGRCICINDRDKYDSSCAAPGRCVFRLLDKIMESL